MKKEYQIYICKIDRRLYITPTEDTDYHKGIACGHYWGTKTDPHWVTHDITLNVITKRDS